MRNKKVLDDLNLVVQINRHIDELSNDREAVEELLVRPASFQVLAHLNELDEPIDPRNLFEHQKATPSATGTCELPFHLQGDTTFGSGSAVQNRKLLQHSNGIYTHIKSLWDVACNKTVIHDDHSTGANHGQQLSRSQYVEFMLLVYKALRFDFQMENATEQILGDWEIDSHSGEFLNADQFHAAIFELVDLWTCDIKEATYTGFLKRLVNRITLRVVVFINDQKLIYSVTDNFNYEELIVKAIPLQIIDSFASVATLAARKGVNTIGELAATDALELEIERQTYVAQNNFSAEKLGKDISHLLEMFGCISKQFHPNAYKLIKLSSKRAFALDGVCYDPEKFSNQDAFTTEEESHNLIDEGSSIESGARKSGPIYDLIKTDLRLVDSIRAAFVIEKDISLERKSTISDINIELRKLGVNPDTLTAKEASSQYHNFYEMLVVKNGQDISALAKTILDQIRFELAAHGIYMEESQLEGAYDEFYSSIVTGNGQHMVQDAKNWIDRAKRDNTASSFIKTEYTTLKSVDAVEPGGFESEDIEAFIMQSTQSEVSIITEAPRIGRLDGIEYSAMKQEVNDNQVEISSKVDVTTVEKCEDTSSQLNSNPNIGIQVLVESASFGAEVSPDTEEATHTIHQWETDTGTKIHLDDKDPESSNTTLSSNLKEGKPAIESFFPCPKEEDVNECDAISHSMLINAPKQITISGFALPILESFDGRDDTIEPHASIIQSVLPPLETGTSVLLHEQSDKTDTPVPSQFTSMPQLISKPEFHINPPMRDTNLDDVSKRTEQEARTIQNVAFSSQSNLPDIGLRYPTDTSPKVPQIVVGGIAGANNVATISRYIRLLDLGTVLDAKYEEEMLQYLTTYEGQQTDLVFVDIANTIENAKEITLRIQSIIGNKLILLGGDNLEQTNEIAQQCIQLGAIYFAVFPFDFSELRAEIFKYFESCPQKYLTRQRRKVLHQPRLKTLVTSNGVQELLTLEKAENAKASASRTKSSKSLSISQQKSTETQLAEPAPRRPSINSSRRDERSRRSRNTLSKWFIK
uniref:Uncharacterized protein AlNc14C23G2384 n=1 Tax=Albugo laibachii Nc14 TaxID=890382 RepID=F0W685_9STRA|nr:conserved hypothetical protein [Albugo laibachii Nc14]|eukprot:CCA16627.1 conserved hypothetical protein [Albugo laibachii Nc14]